MSIRERDQQLGLLRAFLTSSRETAPNSLILQGPTSTGKSIVLKQVLGQLPVKFSIIHCDECVSYKILWKKILQSVQLDSGLIQKDELSYDALATTNFQTFIKQMSVFLEDYHYDELHYVVLDRSDQIMDDIEVLFKNFIKLQEVSPLKNLSFIFVTRTIPSCITTSSTPVIIFPSYSGDELIRILGSAPLCRFNVEVEGKVLERFWKQYVKLVVEMYSSYTNNIMVLKLILTRIWPIFVQPIEEGELKPNEFLTLYRRNYKAIGSDYVISSSLDTEWDDEENEHQSSNLPTISKYILISTYIASYSESKSDWTMFSRLKDYHRKKTFRRSTRSSNRVNQRLLDASYFDLERALAILQAIYTIETGSNLHTDIDIMTQVANLSSMKLLLKSNNNDFISAKTKWKINCSFEYVKSLADDLNFPIDHYLTE